MTELSMHQLTPGYVERYTDTATDTHGGFSVGMIRDLPSWQLPPGACYDASDMLCDRPGKIRKRGGTTSPSSSDRTAAVENLISYKSGALDGLSGLWGTLGKAGTTAILFNTATGAATSVFTDGSVNTIAMRPFQYLNLIVTSFQGTGFTTNDRNTTWLFGGGTGAFTGAVAGTVTANDNRVTGLTAAGLTAAHLGDMINITGSGGSGFVYNGRIIEVTSATAVRVEPVPTQGFTIGQAIVQPEWKWSPHATDNQVTGRFGCAYQGRMVFGYTLLTGPANTDYAKGLDYQPNRIVWSTLPTESPTLNYAAGTSIDGYQFLAGNPFLPLNFLDTPGLGGMTGMAPVGDGQLILFGPNRAFRISGQLSTETVANPIFSFSDDQVSQNVGCISARSIQYTPVGLVWAYLDNLYVYDGSRMKPLLSGTNARYFQDRLRTGDAIYGSAWVGSRNHYYLSMSGSDGGLMVDFENYATTRITNVQLFDAVPDPVNSSTLWGYRWWDTTTTAPTFTKGGLIQLDPIWVPTSANKTDADGTAVLSTFQSPAYVEGLLSHIKTTTRIRVNYDLRGSGSPTATVSADTKLNVADAVYASLATAGGTLADTTAAADTGFAHIDPAPLLADGQAIEIKVAMNAAANIFEILQIELGTQSQAKLL